MFNKFQIDIPLLIIFLLLAASLLAFFLDVLPYPFGILVLIFFGMARIIHLRNKS
jgi:hypothetical protein